MKPPLAPLHVEVETEFSDSIYQAIIWLPEEDQTEGGSVRLEIEKDVPWSPIALRELAKTLLDVASALEAPTHEKRRQRLIQETGFMSRNGLLKLTEYEPIQK